MLRGALVGAVVACVALSACTNDDPAPDPTTTSAAATEEPTADATTEPAEILPPEKPTLMDSNDAIGARAAAEYFLSLYGYVFQTGDLTEWDAMCHPESEFCTGVHEDVSGNVSNGYFQADGDVTFSVERVVDPSAEVDSYEVVGRLSQDAFEIRGRDGTLATSGPGEVDTPTSVFVRLSEDGQWLIREIFVGVDQ